MRDNSFDERIDSSAGLDQQEYLAGALQIGDQFFNAVTADNVFTLGTCLHKGINLTDGAIEYGHLKTMAFHVQY